MLKKFPGCNWEKLLWTVMVVPFVVSILVSCV